MTKYHQKARESTQERQYQLSLDLAPEGGLTTFGPVTKQGWSDVVAGIGCTPKRIEAYAS